MDENELHLYLFGNLRRDRVRLGRVGSMKVAYSRAAMPWRASFFFIQFPLSVCNLDRKRSLSVSSPLRIESVIISAHLTTPRKREISVVSVLPSLRANLGTGYDKGSVRPSVRPSVVFAQAIVRTE